MTHCTVRFHNILWFHLKACIKNGGFLFWTINIMKFWSHCKSNEMKCNKVSKSIEWEYLAHTFVFPSLFLYSVRITSSTFKHTLRNDWGTLRVWRPIPTSLAELIASEKSLIPGKKLGIAGKCVQGHLRQSLGSSTTHLKPSLVSTVQFLMPQIL